MSIGKEKEISIAGEMEAGLYDENGELLVDYLVPDNLKKIVGVDSMKADLD